MVNKVIKVSQQLDTKIGVFVNQAFARVFLQFETEDGNEAEIELDMEAAITTLSIMDNGGEVNNDLMSVRPGINPTLQGNILYAAVGALIGMVFMYVIV